MSVYILLFKTNHTDKMSVFRKGTKCLFSKDIILYDIENIFFSCNCHYMMGGYGRMIVYYLKKTCDSDLMCIYLQKVFKKEGKNKYYPHLPTFQ